MDETCFWGNKLPCGHANLFQSRLTLCDPVDYRLHPVSSLHGIPQARILERVNMSSSRGYSWPRKISCLLHWQSGSLPLLPPRKPYNKLDFLANVNFLLVGSRHRVLRITINHIAYRCVLFFFLIQIQVNNTQTISFSEMHIQMKNLRNPVVSGLKSQALSLNKHVGVRTPCWGALNRPQNHLGAGW